MGLFRSALAVACLFLFGISASPAPASVIFTEKQVLTRDKTLDVTVWRPDSAFDAADTAWSCGKAYGTLNVSSCLVRPYVRTSNVRDQYLYWAFLNLSGGTERADLTPQVEEQEAFFEGLQKPLLALKQKGGTCQYLIAYHDGYAPLAAGTVLCPDLATALRGVEEDMAGHASMVPSRDKAPGSKHVMHRGEFSTDVPNAIDWGLEAAPALAIGWSSDHTDSAGPFTSEVRTFDFNDLATRDLFPLAVRAFMVYKGSVGLRLGYAYSSFDLASEFKDRIRADLAAQGQTLDDWKIARHDYSLELTAGKPYTNGNAELGWYASIGFAKVDFRETATVSGKDYKDAGLLADQTAFLIGAGGEVKLARCIVMGLELGLMVKDFELRNSTRQPDGSGNEIQLRLRLGGFSRMHLASPAAPDHAP
ncbi:MAG: hypothetical protein JWP91_3407 [Fibrobacteres bacterium]|nr:hypothetical protein [Fibrobacterota bacterium]